MTIKPIRWSVGIFQKRTGRISSRCSLGLKVALLAAAFAQSAGAMTTNLVFTTQPTSTVVGAPLSNVVVQFRDSRGTNLSIAGVPVTISLFKGSGLVGSLRVPTDLAGKSVFSNLAVNQFGNGDVLQAAAPNFKTITSARFNLTQGKTLTDLTAPTSVVTYGQPVTFTAKVSALAPAKGFPSGSVIFKDGGTVLGTANLVSLSAGFTITNRLLAGSHSLRAFFSGDTNFAASTSPVFALTVSKLPLNVVGITASNKVYDAKTTVALKKTSAALAGVLSGDNVLLNSNSASGMLVDKNVGAGKTVFITGLSISGSNAANYSVTQPTATASITTAPLMLTAKGVNKIYDSTATATVTLADNRLGGDSLTNLFASATFNNKSVGVGKPVAVTGLSIVGPDAVNYFLSNSNATTTANITAAALTVSGITASNKIYDAKSTAGLNFSAATFTGMVVGDGLTLVTTSAKGAFASKAVGVNKAVTISGLLVSGTNAANYAFTQPSGTATIAPASLTVTAKGVNKIYDGTTNATVTLADNRLAGDAVADAFGSASFASASVGTNKLIFVSGLAVTGADAGNYVLQNTNATTAANITAAKLFVIADSLARPFGVTNPPLTFSFVGFVNSETVANVSGNPVLITTAKTKSAPGNFPITITKGTLAAVNYVFGFSNGVLTVNPAETIATLTSGLNPARTNQNITFSTRVRSVNPSAPAPTGSVRFKCNGTNVLAGSVTLTNGITTLMIPAAVIASSSAVVVTAEFADPAGNFSSSSNSLTQTIVISTPTIGNISLPPQKSDGSFRAALAGTPGQTFIIQASTDLVHWAAISTNIADVNGIVSIIESNTVAVPSRFYRGVLPLP